MRIAARLAALALAFLGLGSGTDPKGEEAATLPSGNLQLELPELGDQKYPPGVLRIPEPEKVRRLVLHLPLKRVHQAFPKINAIGTGLVQSIRSRADEVLCDIDLSLHQGRFYAFGESDNTVEIKVVPVPGAEPIYAKWVIAPPKEPRAWRTEERPKVDASLARAGMSGEGLLAFEELEDGSLNRLEKGITLGKRLFLQARFPRREESVSLRVHWAAEGGAERTFSVGSWKGDDGSQGAKGGDGRLATLEGAVELALGSNRLEVEVLHGYTPVYRSTYKVVRRASSSPTAVVGEKWAVVVGISDYRAEGLDLRYAERDAVAMRDFLVEKGGFHADRVRLLGDQRATYQEIRTALFQFLAGTQPQDLVFLFVAGHGVPDPANPDNYFLLAHDSEKGNLGGTALPMWDLGNVMDYTIRSQRILVFADTCHSGALVEGSGAKEGAGLNFFNKYLETLARKKGRLVVTASQAHERSLEDAKLGHGVFTNALLLGLAGAADDNPADGVVTASELVDYVRAKVPDDTAGEQHPSFSQQGFDMNLPLAYVRRAPAGKR